MVLNFNLATVGFLFLFAGLMLALAGSSYVVGGSTDVPYNIVYPAEAIGFVLSLIGILLIIFRAR